ncbi:cupin domain-containing protein [Rufibacter sp. DG15C]|uniref:cupin domain-containing protein n=1 Tax=Rufibacter sp. DG15C TaxID=1379909 RepID=UPI000832AF25|nr:cupin domain-containing protein [Rufibacter sp. DG15C]
MNQPTELIQSGLLELYVMGAASPQEITLVEQMAEQHPAVREELDAISLTMEAYAETHAVEPCPNVKPLLLATIAYMERLKEGEAPIEAPMLSPSSTVEDYRQWLNRPDLALSGELEDIHAHLISATPEVITAIAWLKEKSSEEVHHDQLERFLIVEGSCIITAGGQQFSLTVGDYYQVPLHVPHVIQVTSDIPCKVIIQRVAA